MNNKEDKKKKKGKDGSSKKDDEDDATAGTFPGQWAKYVHRVKVHELLRCLEAEQTKLRVLREHLNLKDINEVQTQENNNGGNEEAKVIFQKPLEEEEKAAAEIAEEIRTNKLEPNYVSKSVIKLFENNQTMTDEQFERILELCKDDLERKQLQEAFQEKRNREKYLHNATEDRRMLYNFLNSGPMHMFMLIIIFLSTIVLFLLSFERINNFYSYGLVFLDAIIMAAFMVEAGLKIYIYKDDYFRSPANSLDLIIIITHFVEILVDLVTDTLAMNMDISGKLWFKFLKSLRSLRVLRAIKFLPSLQVIITTIIQSLISISSIAALMLLFMFVFAVVGRELFRERDDKRFGSFQKTLLTLFQLLTLDDWGDILEDNEYAPEMFIYLFLYIVCEFFVFLNLFVAVLVDNFQLSIEAAQTVMDADEEELKWKQRLERLAEQKIKNSDSLHSRHKDPVLELPIHEYMRVGKDSREATLMAENLKKMTAIDFQYFMWNRRMRLASIVLEAATSDRGLNVGQLNPEIPPVDKTEPDIRDPDDLPLKPKRIPKKRNDMDESNFKLKPRTDNNKKKKRHSVFKPDHNVNPLAKVKNKPGNADDKKDGKKDDKKEQNNNKKKK